MAGVIDIVNQALSALGEAPITALTDPGRSAGLASILYESTRDALISEHSWIFAKDRVMLPSLAVKPLFGWGYQYLLPGDCLRVLLAGPWPQPVMADYIAGENRAWEIEGQNLLSNHGPTINLIYLRRVEDAGYYPPAFTEALAAKLALKMCERISASNSKRELAAREFDQAVKAARRVNAIQLPPQRPGDGEWMAVHIRGGGW